MKNPMLKLYDKMNPEGLAALQVNAWLHQDDRNFGPILQAVICDGERSRVEGYRQRKESLLLAAMFWTNDCLRTTANLASLSSIIVSGSSTSEQILRADFLHKVFQYRLAALKVAMAEFAEETGLDFAGLQALAQADLCDPDIAVKPTPEMVGELLNQYRGFL